MILIHCIAMCKTCGKEWQNYLTARNLARTHANNLGHHVIGEAAYSFQYGKPHAAQEEKK